MRDGTTPNIFDQDTYAKYLKSAALFIWDEAAQGSKFQANMIDIYMQKMTGRKQPFGGKPFLATGDWRQTLPILKGFKVAKILVNTKNVNNVADHNKA